MNIISIPFVMPLYFLKFFLFLPTLFYTFFKTFRALQMMQNISISFNIILLFSEIVKLLNNNALF